MKLPKYDIELLGKCKAKDLSGNWRYGQCRYQYKDTVIYYIVGESSNFREIEIDPETICFPVKISDKIFYEGEILTTIINGDFRLHWIIFYNNGQWRIINEMQYNYEQIEKSALLVNFVKNCKFERAWNIFDNTELLKPGKKVSKEKIK